MRSPLVYTAEGIVLKRRNFGESDRMLTVFTKHYGKIRVLAKGVRRIHSRRAGHIELFRRVTLTLHKGKNFDTVQEAQSFPQPDRWSTLSKMAGAYYVSELVDTLLAEEQEHRDVYILLVDVLSHLLAGGEAGEQSESLRQFANKLLWSLGFLPRSKELSTEHVNSYVESIIEKKLRSKQLLTRLG